MKLKSFVTATLALGLLSTVGAALPSHEALDSNNGYKDFYNGWKTHCALHDLSRWYYCITSNLLCFSRK